MELARDREGPMALLKLYYDAGMFKFDEDGLTATICDGVCSTDSADSAERTERTERTEKTILPAELAALLAKYRPIQAELERDRFLGSYSSFIGSPTSQGLFQYDLWKVQPLPQSESGLDWARLKAEVAQHGLRNSLLRANMPTASTSQILGNAESIEPYKYCIYTRRVLAGEFVVVNKHLHKDLAALGLWNEDIKAQIMAGRGSVQHIDVLPRAFRDKYKTAYEISKKVAQIFREEHDPFVDQTTSFNAFIAEPTDSILTKMHVGAWKAGLKTGMYYLRREPVAHAVRYDKRTGLSVTTKETKDTKPKEDAECVACSA